MSGEEILFTSSCRPYMSDAHRSGFTFIFRKSTIEMSWEILYSPRKYQVLQVPEIVQDLDHNSDVRLKPIMQLLKEKIDPIPGIWERFVDKVSKGKGLKRDSRLMAMAKDKILSDCFVSDNIGHIFILTYFAWEGSSGALQQLLMSALYETIGMTNDKVTSLLLIVIKCMGATSFYPTIPKASIGFRSIPEINLAIHLENTLPEMKGRKDLLIDILREWAVPNEYRMAGETIRNIWLPQSMDQRMNCMMTYAAMDVENAPLLSSELSLI